MGWPEARTPGGVRWWGVECCCPRASVIRKRSGERDPAIRGVRVRPCSQEIASSDWNYLSFLPTGHFTRMRTLPLLADKFLEGFQEKWEPHQLVLNKMEEHIAGWMVGHRLRRWPTIQPAMATFARSGISPWTILSSHWRHRGSSPAKNSLNMEMPRSANLESHFVAGESGSDCHLGFG